MIIQRAPGNQKNIRNDGNPYTIFMDHYQKLIIIKAYIIMPFNKSLQLTSSYAVSLRYTLYCSSTKLNPWNELLFIKIIGDYAIDPTFNDGEHMPFWGDKLYR